MNSFSDFGNKLTGDSGILRLMDDLGTPFPEGVRQYPLGGGNPAQIPEIEKLYRREMERILGDGRAFEDLIGKYDGPQGRSSFISAVTDFFRKNYGWNITEENVCVTNGSQSACFYLFNLLAGKAEDGKVQKKILFPLSPEYVGYADQGIEKGMFLSVQSRFEEYEDHTFKYFADIPRVEKAVKENPSVAALCVSRPANPTGNVLTDTEIEQLTDIARRNGIPLIIDNAYGFPWPSIIFNDEAELTWNEDIILSMSMSKIGLPNLRTGIIIARKETVKALANLNSIIALASGGFGQALAENIIRTGELVKAARTYVRPFYEAKNRKCQEYIHKYFAGTDYAVHKGEGSIFIWLLMKDLAVTSKELYLILKKRGVVVVPGEYFFFADEHACDHPHYSKCIRINYGCDDSLLEEGIRIIAEEARRHSCR